MPEQLDEPAARGLSLKGALLPVYTEPVRAPIGTTPARRPHSVRRTMSIDVEWPGGFMEAGRYLGRARDIVTLDPADTPRVLDEAEAHLTIAMRQILDISSTPSPPRLRQLVGVRAGGHLRAALDTNVPEEKAAGTPLYLLLDDMAGASLVSMWTISQWHGQVLEQLRKNAPPREMKGVCIGFRPGSSALGEEDRPLRSQNATRVVPLPNPDDPQGWHPMPELPGMNFRRARRIDVWREGGELRVESHFQDSASAPDGGARLAIHEYLTRATVGPDGLLQTIEATPGTLPYSSCRVAPVNLEVLLGTPARDLRDTVLERLKFTGGCTHLNDMVRSLAEAPVLAGSLP